MSAARICRHPLRIVPHAPQWLTCDICRADFPHCEDCPGRGSPQCIAKCAQDVPTPTVADLALWFALPARTPDHERTD